MKADNTVRLKNRRLIGEDVLYYDFVCYLGEWSYLCLCRSFLCLCTTDCSSVILKVQYSQIDGIVLDTQYQQLFALQIKREEDLVFECVGDRMKTISEISVICSTDYTMRTLKMSKMKVTESELMYKRKPLPLDKNLEIPEGHQVMYMESYYFVADASLSEIDRKNNSTSSPNIYIKDYEDTKGDVTLQIRYKKRAILDHLNIKNFTEQVAENFVYKHREEYYVDVANSLRKEARFKRDKSAWDAYQLGAQNESEYVIIYSLRRMYIPPEAEYGDDFVFIFTIKNSAEEGKKAYWKDHSSEIVLSMNPLPQTFQYDELRIQATLESLRCDEVFYLWCAKYLMKRPELAPLNPKIESSRPRRDLFVKSILRFLMKNSIFISGLQDDQSDDPDLDWFDIEEDIFSNTDSPDTVKFPQETDLINWRYKLAKYLAFYVDGNYVKAFDFRSMIKILEHKSTSDTVKQRIRELLEYFLHLRINKFAKYDRDMPLEEKIEPTLAMNERVFCKLLHLNYFELFLDASSFVRLLAYVLNSFSKISTLGEICMKISQLLQRSEYKQEFLANPDFIPTLTNLLRYNDDGVVFFCSKVLISLCADSASAKDVVILSGAAKSIKFQLQKKRPVLCTILANLVRSLMSSRNNKTNLLDSGVIRDMTSLLQFKVSKFERVQAEREKVVSALVQALWNFASDEKCSNILVQYGIIPLLVNIFRLTNSCDVLHKICGCVMVMSSHSDDIKSKLGNGGVIPLVSCCIVNCISEYQRRHGQNKEQDGSTSTNNNNNNLSPTSQHPQTFIGLSKLTDEEKVLLRMSTGALYMLLQYPENINILRQSPDKSANPRLLSSLSFIVENEYGDPNTTRIATELRKKIAAI